MRTIGVVSVARSDYGIYLPVLKKIKAASDLKLRLIVGGMHLSPEFGLTVRTIEKDGFEVNERVETLLSSDTPEGIAKSIGLGTISFAQLYARERPDILVVLGDRFEMYAAALAALPFKLPIAHIHGGEVTEGAIDDSLRHSMTKLSHLHFVSTADYAQRVIQLGEEPWRVTISGAPSLDNLETTKLLSREELSDRCGLRLGDQDFLLVTFHPVTRQYEQTERQFSELLGAIEEIGLPAVLTMPNADTGGRGLIKMIKEFVSQHESAQAVDNLGTAAYFSMMSEAAAMVGNSSSGIIEAASFALPVVNVGIRQFGRIRGVNVIDVGHEKRDILAGLQRALDASFRESLGQTLNPYGSGVASEKIVEVLSRVELGDRLLIKHFHDLPAWPEARSDRDGI